MTAGRGESLEQKGIRALLLDVEGTTTSVEFVYETLFPYARAHVEEYLRGHGGSPEIHSIVGDLRTEYQSDSATGTGLPAWDEADSLGSATRYALWLMDRDRKSTPLKTLQGRVWEGAFRSGEVRGHVYEDVPGEFRRWRDDGVEIYIYSSGSIASQKLLFGYSVAGDLTRYISGHFDTTTGSKTEAASYQAIAEDCGLSPAELLFVSDSPAELAAAREAGLRILASVRPGNAPLPESLPCPVVSAFGNIASAL